MNTLYKYYSMNFDLLSYLQDPSIRLSQIHLLNDPFEGMLPDDLLKKIVPLLQKEMYPEEPDSKSRRLNVVSSLRKTINDFGVTSVSETHRNLLMWAHYASEHKGVCIGYNPEMLEPKNEYYKKHTNGSVAFELKKVNYDTVPFDSSHIDEVSSEEIVSDAAFESIGERAITTKSDAWLYEKEHRYIANINFCEQIAIFRKKENLADYMNRAIETATTQKTYDVIYGDRSVILKSKRSPAQIVENIIEENCPVITGLAPSKEVAFLVGIKRDDIKTIHLGARFDYRKRLEIIELIKSNVDMQHIKVFQYERSSNRYELVESIVHPE